MGADGGGASGGSGLRPSANELLWKLVGYELARGQGGGVRFVYWGIGGPPRVETVDQEVLFKVDPDDLQELIEARFVTRSFPSSPINYAFTVSPRGVQQVDRAWPGRWRLTKLEIALGSAAFAVGVVLVPGDFDTLRRIGIGLSLAVTASFGARALVLLPRKPLTGDITLAIIGIALTLSFFLLGGPTPPTASQNDGGSEASPRVAGSPFVAASPSVELPTGTLAAAAPTASPPPPTPSPTPESSPYTGTVNLSGKVASDVPGTLVALPVTITSVIDGNTKPRDVYAIALRAGTTLRINLKVGLAWTSMIVANPRSTSMDIDGGYTGTVLWEYGAICCFDRSGAYSFTAAVSGTYYVAFSTRDSSQKYTLRLSK